MFQEHPPAIVQQVATYQDLVTRARARISGANWAIGQDAVTAEKEFGQAVEQFADDVEQSVDTIQRAKRTWEKFHDSPFRASLRHTFFLKALAWEDANECLAWAAENEASVDAMKAWRRAKHGEDLHSPASDEDDELPEDSEPMTPTHIRYDSSKVETSEYSPFKSAATDITQPPERPPLSAGDSKPEQEHSGKDAGSKPNREANSKPAETVNAGPELAATAKQQLLELIASLEIDEICKLIESSKGAPADKVKALRALADKLDRQKKPKLTAADADWPAELYSEDAWDALNQWLEYRVAIKRPYKRGIETVNKELLEWVERGPERLAAAIRNSIRREYQGIYEDTDSNDAINRRPTNAQLNEVANADAFSTIQYADE
jgi:hypothetical protein